ncbi:SDR family oxidoreductase [Marinomonas sp. 15G1-11]|uniref:SDR family oxidoreductase n=1 Tax=Marinomonas phaeophyticola TaxID=3004091 RepID=A0ABT4JRK7_9GAMM|nr:SDR family oxidoreductase [Marinomonas sp. 15G1-11]MCZ2721017.1 SDR family oxidoreductase [Marinomonas sp. 15G1-11]
MSNVTLITGTSTGLGISLAIQFAKQGHKVFATMRNLEKKAALESAMKAANVSLEIKQLDVQDTASIERCVSEIINQEGHIDQLINNAGAGYVRTTEQTTEADIQWVMDVNFLGVVRCIKAVLPHMRQARHGHIINISSVGGLIGQPFNEIYCAAKFALEGYVESVSTYITPNFNVKFTNIEPGGISSEFANNALAQFTASGGMRDDEYRPLLEKYITNAQNRALGESIYQTADEVADIVVSCARSSTPPIRMRTSPWGEQFCELKTQADPSGHIQQQKIITQLLQ